MQDVGKQNKTDLAAHQVELARLDMSQVQQICQTLLTKDTYQPGTFKPTLLILQHQVIRKLIINALAQLGMQHKQGKAPASALEDECQKWLTMLEDV